MTLKYFGMATLLLCSTAMTPNSNTSKTTEAAVAANMVHHKSIHRNKSTNSKHSSKQRTQTQQTASADFANSKARGVGNANNSHIEAPGSIATSNGTGGVGTLNNRVFTLATETTGFPIIGLSAPITAMTATAAGQVIVATNISGNTSTIQLYPAAGGAPTSFTTKALGTVTKLVSNGVVVVGMNSELPTQLDIWTIASNAQLNHSTYTVETLYAPAAPTVLLPITDIAINTNGTVNVFITGGTNYLEVAIVNTTTAVTTYSGSSPNLFGAATSIAAANISSAAGYTFVTNNTNTYIIEVISEAVGNVKAQFNASAVVSTTVPMVAIGNKLFYVTSTNIKLANFTSTLTPTPTVPATVTTTGAFAVDAGATKIISLPKTVAGAASIFDAATPGAALYTVAAGAGATFQAVAAGTTYYYLSNDGAGIPTLKAYPVAATALPAAHITFTAPSTYVKYIAANTADTASSTTNVLFTVETTADTIVNYYSANAAARNTTTAASGAITKLVASNNYVAALSGGGGLYLVDIWTVDGTTANVAFPIGIINATSIALTIENSINYLYVTIAGDNSATKYVLTNSGGVIYPNATPNLTNTAGFIPNAAGNILKVATGAVNNALLVYAAEPSVVEAYNVTNGGSFYQSASPAGGITLPAAPTNLAAANFGFINKVAVAGGTSLNILNFDNTATLTTTAVTAVTPIIPVAGSNITQLAAAGGANDFYASAGNNVVYGYTAAGVALAGSPLALTTGGVVNFLAAYPIVAILSGQ